MTDKIAANSIKNLLLVLHIISTQSVTRSEIEAQTGISRATLTRLLRVAQIHCDVEIKFMRTKSRGYYKIINYGVFSKRKIYAQHTKR